MPGSPAEKAGLPPGDVVLSLDGKRMENGRQFRINVYTRGVGEQVAVEVRRGDRTLTVRVPVVERESDDGQLEALIGTPAGRSARSGSLRLDLTPPIADLLPPLRRDKGAVVARVTPEAPFSQQGRLQPGDVDLRAQRQGDRGVEELKKAAAALAARRRGGAPDRAREHADVSRVPSGAVRVRIRNTLTSPRKRRGRA